MIQGRFLNHLSHAEWCFAVLIKWGHIKCVEKVRNEVSFQVRSKLGGTCCFGDIQDSNVGLILCLQDNMMALNDG